MARKVDHPGSALLAATLAVFLLAMTAPADAEENVWPTLKQTTFGDRAIKEEDGKVVLDAPVTALDASLVPLTVRVPPEVKDNLKSLTLIIDKNPNPVVAKIEFGPAAGNGGERSVSTRVRSCTDAPSADDGIATGAFSVSASCWSVLSPTKYALAPVSGLVAVAHCDGVDSPSQVAFSPATSGSLVRSSNSSVSNEPLCTRYPVGASASPICV